MFFEVALHVFEPESNHFTYADMGDYRGTRYGSPRMPQQPLLGYLEHGRNFFGRVKSARWGRDDSRNSNTA
jgi:hypothetical protein